MRAAFFVPPCLPPRLTNHISSEQIWGIEARREYMLNRQKEQRRVTAKSGLQRIPWYCSCQSMGVLGGPWHTKTA